MGTGSRAPKCIESPFSAITKIFSSMKSIPLGPRRKLVWALAGSTSEGPLRSAVSWEGWRAQPPNK